MKKMLVMLTCLLMSASVVAEDYSIPQKVVVISKSNVNIRQSPDTKGEALYKASKGTLFEFVSQSGSWYEVKEAYTGKTVYVSATVSKVLEEEKVPLTKGCTNYGPSETDNYIHKESNSKSEATTSLDFYTNKEKEDGYLYLRSSWMYADVSGRTNSMETLYRGYQKGWYMVFDSTIDYEGNVTPLETPIIYYAIGFGDRVTSEGVVYTLDSGFTW